MNSSRYVKTVLPVAALLALFIAPARADIMSEIGGNAKNYVVLFGGGSGATLDSDMTTVNGNIGIGGTGKIDITTGGSYEDIDFSAACKGTYPHCSQYSSSGGASYTSLDYGVTNVTTDLSDVSTFSSKVAAEAGTALSIDLTGSAGHKTLTIDASSGKLDSNGNYVFKVSSTFAFAAGTTLTIVGNVPGNVILDFGNLSPVIEGNINLQGISSDQVLFNVTGGNLTIENDSVSGTFVDTKGQVLVSASDVYGRVFSTSSGSTDLANCDTITAPTPEPASVVLFGTVILACLPMLRRRMIRSAGKA
jgi:hypothetical protein